MRLACRDKTGDLGALAQTKRQCLGARLLALIDSSIPGNDHPRQVLDEQADALDPATFEVVASKAQIA